MIANKNTTGSAFAKNAQQAKAIERQLVADLMGSQLGLTFEQAVGVVANLAHESKASSATYGFSAYNEENPTVPGSRGGAGWAQWTADRRREFEAWAAQNNLPLDSYEANFGFMVHELTGSEKKALEAIKSAATVDEAVKATMNKYERPGIKHAVSRYEMADKIAAPLVSEMQKSLSDLGLYDGPIDGIMGPQTQAALGDYNMANGSLSPSAAISSLAPSMRDTTRAMEDQSMAALGDYLDNRSFRQTEIDSMRTMGLQGLPQGLAAAPGGIFDYTRAAADMMPGFDPREAGQNLQASLGVDMSGTAPAYPETPRSYPSVTPSVTSAPGGILSPSDLAAQYSQYQPSSGSAWQNQPTVNERMASPSTPTVEQQRVADAVRQSIAPQVASAPGGLFQPTGAFNNINQTQPTGSFNPTSPFGNGLAAASPAKSGVEQFYDPQQVQRVNEIDKWEQARNAAAKPSAPVSPVTPAVSTAYQNYAASRMAAPATAVPASRAAGIDLPNSAMSLADQYASYGAGKVAPAPMQTASSATQAAPPMEAPRTVAPRQVTPYTPPAPVAPAQPAMTPERARALGMVPTQGVPGKYMPDVKANPAQVFRDQLGLIAANPFEALARMAMGTLQGGVFHAGNTLGNIASAPGGLFGGSTASGGSAGGYDGGGWSGGSYSGTGYSGRDANPAPGGGFGGFQSDSGFTFDR